MMRLPGAVLLTLLAATALPAAKPVPPAGAPAGGAPDAAREAWRSQGVSICVAELRAVPDLSPDDLESICGCAFDRYLEGQVAPPLPRLDEGRLQGVMSGRLIACTTRLRPERAADVARLGLAAPGPAPVTEARPANAKPADTGSDDAPADAGGGDSGGGFLDWVRGITLPAWLTGASALWWVAIGIFLFGLLILKLRRRDPRSDLMGPPSHMRRGVPPRPPRRPDLPR